MVDKFFQGPRDRGTIDLTGQLEKSACDFALDHYFTSI